MEDYVVKATGSLSNTVRAKNNEYHGFYRGTVVNNDDTENRGRCKIYIRGVYNEEFEGNDGAQLPWAEPCQPLFCGGGGSNGTFQCPDMNSTVWCFFENGDVMKPVFFGQTTDKDGTFNTSKCRFHWEDMDIEMDKTAQTITLKANTIKLNANFIEMNAQDTVITSTAKLDITAPVGRTFGDFSPSNGVDGVIDGKTIATVKKGVIIGIA